MRGGGEGRAVNRTTDRSFQAEPEAKNLALAYRRGGFFGLTKEGAV